jgi:hypothetical protein
MMHINIFQNLRLLAFVPEIALWSSSMNQKPLEIISSKTKLVPESISLKVGTGERGQ